MQKISLLKSDLSDTIVKTCFKNITCYKFLFWFPCCTEEVAFTKSINQSIIHEVGWESSKVTMETAEIINRLQLLY